MAAVKPAFWVSAAQKLCPIATSASSCKKPKVRGFAFVDAPLPKRDPRRSPGRFSGRLAATDVDFQAVECCDDSAQGMSGLEQMSAVEGRGANRGSKRLIVHVGVGVIVLLLIIDVVLLYLFVTANSKNVGKATKAAALRLLRSTVGVVNRADDDEAYILLVSFTSAFTLQRTMLS